MIPAGARLKLSAQFRERFASLDSIDLQDEVTYALAGLEDLKPARLAARHESGNIHSRSAYGTGHTTRVLVGAGWKHRHPYLLAIDVFELSPEEPTPEERVRDAQLIWDAWEPGNSAAPRS